jgi:DNA polymerase epsilon subunit 3
LTCLAFTFTFPPLPPQLTHPAASAHDQALDRSGRSITAGDVIKAVAEMDFGPADVLVPILEQELAAYRAQVAAAKAAKAKGGAARRAKAKAAAGADGDADVSMAVDDDEDDDDGEEGEGEGGGEGEEGEGEGEGDEEGEAGSGAE